jgi:hypothetical protein
MSNKSSSTSKPAAANPVFQGFDFMYFHEMIS